VNGAGRTDAGVHARGQVASFLSATALPARAVAAIATRELPADVRIVEAREAEAGFHARHSARARRYAYRLLEADDVLLGRFAWWPMKPLDGEALNRAVAPLVGRHDCRAFEAAGSSPAKPGVRDLARALGALRGRLALRRARGPLPLPHGAQPGRHRAARVRAPGSRRARRGGAGLARPLARRPARRRRAACASKRSSTRSPEGSPRETPPPRPRAGRAVRARPSRLRAAARPGDIGDSRRSAIVSARSA